MFSDGELEGFAYPYPFPQPVSQVPPSLFTVIDHIKLTIQSQFYEVQTSVRMELTSHKNLLFIIKLYTF